MTKFMMIVAATAVGFAGPAAATGGWGFAQPTRAASVGIVADGGGITTCYSGHCLTGAEATVNTEAYTNTSPRATGTYELEVSSGGLGFAHDDMAMVTQIAAEGSVVADASRKPATASSEGGVLIDSIAIGGDIFASQGGTVLVRGEATDSKYYDSARAVAGAAAVQHMRATTHGGPSAAAAVDTIVNVSVDANDDD